jgi:predicted HicB family RNase H-like nuclease
MCADDGVASRNEISGRFNIRIPRGLHRKRVQVAPASGKILNQQVADMLWENVERF